MEEAEKMSAFVDLNTGKIVGAKEGTKVWWHEKGHIKYNSCEFGMRNSFREQSSFNLTVTLTLLSLFWPLLRWYALGMGLATFYYFLYEEAWCWTYAFKKCKEVKDKNGNETKN